MGGGQCYCTGLLKMISTNCKYGQGVKEGKDYVCVRETFTSVVSTRPKVNGNIFKGNNMHFHFCMHSP